MPKTNRPNALDYIPGLIEQGYGNSQIVNWLRDNDMSYRTQNMFRDINEIRSGVWGNAKILELPPDSVIPDKYLKTWEGDTSFDYRVVIRYHYIDMESGRGYESGATLYSNSSFTQGAVKDWFDVHRQTLESGTDTDPNMKHVLSAVSVEYFKNVEKRDH